MQLNVVCCFSNMDEKHRILSVKITIIKLWRYDFHHLPMLSFSHDQNDITFDYIGLHYKKSAQNQYAVKLDGFDSDWRLIGYDHVGI